MILAALGGNTPHMQSAAILALSRLLYEQHTNPSSHDNDNALYELLPGILSTILLLAATPHREVCKAVVGFIRIGIVAYQELSEEQLQGVLNALCNPQHVHMGRFRNKIKIIVRILLRKYGSEAVLKCMEEQGDARLVKHVVKLANREARKKQQQKQQQQQDDHNQNTIGYDEMLDEDDHENDSLMGRTLVTGMTTKYSRKSSATKAAILAQANANVRIAETKDGNVLDLLDHNNDQSKQVRFADMEDDDEDGWSEDGAMEFDEDGRLVVVDEDDDVTLSTKKSKHLQGDVDDDDNDGGGGVKKRRRGNDNSSYQKNNKLEQAKQRRNDRHLSKNNNTLKSKALGAAYKSNKAGGDVKRKNQKFEPYAFMPLDGKKYTKKFRRGTVQQMETVVRGKKQSQKRKR